MRGDIYRTTSSVSWTKMDFNNLFYNQCNRLSGEIFAHRWMDAPTSTSSLPLQLILHPMTLAMSCLRASKSTYNCYNVYLRQQFSKQDVYFKRAKYLRNIVLSKCTTGTDISRLLGRHFRSYFVQGFVT